MGSAVLVARSNRTVNIRKENGFTLIDMIFVCALIGLLCAISLPKLLLARQYAGAASAIGSMRAISSSQLSFALTCGAGFYAPNLTTLGTPPPGSVEAFISPNLGGANIVTKAGYTVQLQATPYVGGPGTCNGLGPGATSQGFKAVADALDVDNIRFFAVNSDAQIWEHDASLLAVMPEVGDPPVGHVLR
jgi:type II secretory pathway pseudopilin PulG